MIWPKFTRNKVKKIKQYLITLFIKKHKRNVVKCESCVTLVIIQFYSVTKYLAFS